MAREENPVEAARSRLAEEASDAMEEAFRLARESLAAESGALPPARDPAQLSRELDLALREEGCSFGELVERLRAVMAATPSSANRRFYNQLFGGRDSAALVGEILAAVSNVSMYTYKVAGPQALIEQELIARMALKVGYDDGDGIFTPGGSLSNLTAMLLARNEAMPAARDEGLDGRRLAVYSSELGHYSILKSAGILGIGRHGVRLVKADGEGRMDVEALAEVLEADRAAGVEPVMIVATAGTTVLGAFDPIRPIAALAREHGTWLHVDGVLGGTLLLSEQYRNLLDGSELSDSFAWNAHKMMGVPLTCSAVLVRRPGLLMRHLDESAEYLFQSADRGLDPGTRSLQCGRRNDVLKLWAAWKYHGDSGYARRVDRQMALARKAVERIESDPNLVLIRRPQSINVCFEVRGVLSDAVCAELDRTGAVKVSYGVVDGRRVIRLVCVNPDLEDEDLETFFAEVERAAASVRG